MGEITEQNIWYLRVLGEMHARYGFTADMLEQMTNAERKEVWWEYARRDDVDTSVLPDTFWVDPPMAGARGKTLKPAHVANEFLTVSREFLDVLQQFDLGLFKSWPVTLLKSDKQTPFEGEWHAIWVATRKDGFLRDKSRKFEVPSYERTKHLAIPHRDAQDGDFVFDASVAAGLDLWSDQNFSQSLLLSDRLHTALKEAGLLKETAGASLPFVRISPRRRGGAGRWGITQPSRMPVTGQDRRSRTDRASRSARRNPLAHGIQRICCPQG